MQNKNSKEIILGAIEGYNFEQIKPFIFTLNKSNFRGDLCLFVSKISKDTYRKLQKYNLKLIPYKHDYPFITKFLVSDDILFEDFSNKISVKYLRYILYYFYLSKYGAKYSKVMLTDVKDVIFQRDPFDFNFNDGLYCFLEDNCFTIKTSPFNSGRIKHHFGEEIIEKIGSNCPSCSGITFGSVSAILNYLKKMIDLLIIIKANGGGDQGLHNYLIYTEQLDNLKLINNDKGIVLTIGSKINKAIHFNKEDLVINDNGKIFNTIHQYDRHPKLFEKFFRNYNLKFPMKFYMKYLWIWKNRIENILGRDIFNQLGWKIVNKLGFKVK